MKKSIIFATSLTTTLLLSPLSQAYPVWNQDTTYQAGEIVTKDGIAYVSTHWNQGSAPINNENNWDGWANFPDNNPNWEPSQTYNGGDIVLFQDKFYLAKYWNKDSQPDQSEAWLILIGADNPTPPTEPETPLDPESKEAILGIDSNNNGLDDVYEEKIEQTYDNQADKELARAIGINWRSMLEYHFHNEDIPSASASKILYQSAFLYICSAQKERKDTGFTPPHDIYFTSIERSYAYRMAEIKLYKAAIPSNKVMIDDSSCNIYK